VCGRRSDCSCWLTDDRATREEDGFVGLIDSHAHLTFPELRNQVDAVLARCDDAGVDAVISIGTDLADAKAAIALAAAHPGRVFVGAGFHPHEADTVDEANLDAMAQLWAADCVVAIGEMGLDYHYDLADRDNQRTAFAGQLARAAAFDKPIVIHCREALADCAPILVEHGFANRRVVFHCFTGSSEEAAVIARHGWRISFTGIVTFPKSLWLQEIAKDYPGDKIMVETDSPYLSPVPVRGKRPNEPSHVAHTARFLANLRGENYDAFVTRTERNTRDFFSLPD